MVELGAHTVEGAARRDIRPAARLARLREPARRDAPTARPPAGATGDEQHDRPARPHRPHQPVRGGRRPPGDPGVGRGALQPGAARRVGGAPAPHACGRHHRGGHLRVLEPPRTRARPSRLRRRARRGRVRVAVRAARVRRRAAHRPVVPRRGAQRRVPRLGAGRTRGAPHRRPRLPRARRRVVRRARRGARAALRAVEPGDRHPARERALRPARSPRHAQADGAPSRPRGADLHRHRVGRRRPARGRGAPPLRRLRRRVLGRRRPAVGHDLPRALLLLARLGRSRHRRRPARPPGRRAPRPRRLAPPALARLPRRHVRARRRHGDRVPPPPAPRCARHRRGRPRQDRQRVGLAGLLHVRRRPEPAPRPPGVAGHRLPQRPPRLRLRLPRADRRGRRPRAEPRRAAPPARLPRRVRRVPRRHAVDPARRAADGRRRRRDDALGAPLRRDIRMGVREPAAAARAARHLSGRSVRDRARLRDRGVPARTRRRAAGHHRALAGEPRAGRRAPALGHGLAADGARLRPTIRRSCSSPKPASRSSSPSTTPR